MKKMVFSIVALTISVMPAMAKWVKCDISELTATDVVVIVDQTKSLAMSNDKGKDNPPLAVPVEFNDNKSELMSDIPDNIKWNIEYRSSGSNYIIYPDGITDKWLYCSDSSNGVRVGIDSNKFLSFDGKFLKEYNTKRYIGVYVNRNEWWCFDDKTNEKIKDTKTTFYKYEEVITAVEEINVDANAPVEYYNLQGVKVVNPEKGIFIKKQGSRTSKVVM